MKRDLLEQLIDWQQHPLRKPLIVRGARQVGKSWLLQSFGQACFDNVIEINFEKDKSAFNLFPERIDIPSIVKGLGYYAHQTVVPGKTLIILDEIQECENALRSLRYFKEDMPELHVVAAGSLLDFAIEKVGMPVGRVQYLYVYPLSFGEFLSVCDRDDLRQMLFQEWPAAPIHERLLEYVKTYSLIGGMPEVVSAWLEHKNAVYCQDVQETIINTYRDDFYKYAHDSQMEALSSVFDAVPEQIGQKFKYSQLDEHVSTYHVKNALQLLQKAGIVYYCYHSSGQGHPLGASIDTKKFKVYFFDIGLAQKLLGLSAKDWLIQPVLPQHNGAMAEQFVAQQLVACSSRNTAAKLYYWHREAKSSNAEIDFLTVKNGEVVPIEVKSGRRGGLKSMHMYLDSHPKSQYGIKVSVQEYQMNEHFMQIPFYGIEKVFGTES